MSKQHSATVAARAGIAQDSAYGAVTPPLYLTSTYELKAFKQPGPYDYSRSNNPTRDLLAETLAERVALGGRIALSGILDGQEEDLLRRYRPWFEQLAVTREGDWVRIDGVRKTA